MNECDCFSMKPKFRRRSKSPIVLILYYLVSFLCFMGWTLSVRPKLMTPEEYPSSKIIRTTIDVTFYLSLLLNFVLSIMDPGMLKPEEQNHYFENKSTGLGNPAENVSALE